jgi:putative oxidoreductase
MPQLAAEEIETVASPKANQITRTSGKGLSVALWTMQVIGAAAFLAAGGTKLAGAPLMVAEFQQIGLGQWFRYLTGLLEVAGAIGLLVPGLAFYGALLLVMVMCGALVAHLTVLGLSTATPAFVLLLLTGTIAYLRRLRSNR